MMDREKKIREEIFKKIELLMHERRSKERFSPGKSPVNYAGRVYDKKDMIALVDASLDFWLTTGRYAAQFEEKFARFLGVKFAMITNSGSSANLLAISALTSPKLGKRRLMPGDEVITVACGFPSRSQRWVFYPMNRLGSIAISPQRLPGVSGGIYTVKKIDDMGMDSY